MTKSHMVITYCHSSSISYEIYNWIKQLKWLMRSQLCKCISSWTLLLETTFHTWRKAQMKTKKRVCVRHSLTWRWRCTAGRCGRLLPAAWPRWGPALAGRASGSPGTLRNAGTGPGSRGCSGGARCRTHLERWQWHGHKSTEHPGVWSTSVFK